MTPRLGIVLCISVPLVVSGLTRALIIGTDSVPGDTPDAGLSNDPSAEEVADNPFRIAFHRAMNQGLADVINSEPESDRLAHRPVVVVLATLTRFYSTVRFDHEIHADMSVMSGGCGNCHHDPASEDGVRIAACRECHAQDGRNATVEQPSLKGAFHRQCLGCHRDWNHENACGFCHREVDDLTITQGSSDATDIVGATHPSITAETVYSYTTSYLSAPVVTFHHLEHVTTFNLKCVDCHRTGSCDRCHDATLQRQPVEHAQDCNSCHARNECRFCHTQQERAEFDHVAQTGWSLEPSHSHLRCTECHGEVTSFVTPTRDCRGCHTRLDPEGFDHAVTGVALSGSHAHYDCGRCHLGGRLNSPATCTNCHADKSYPADMPG